MIERINMNGNEDKAHEYMLSGVRCGLFTSLLLLPFPHSSLLHGHSPTTIRDYKRTNERTNDVSLRSKSRSYGRKVAKVIEPHRHAHHFTFTFNSSECDRNERMNE